MDSSDDKEALAKRNIDRDKAIAELTKNLAWKLCTDLLSPPLEKERIKREPELVAKLNGVIERVQQSRNKKLVDNEEVYQVRIE
jgi:hypothetical protein